MATVWATASRFLGIGDADLATKRRESVEFIGNSPPVAAKSSIPTLPPGTPEFAVDRDTLISFFNPQIGKSTFHDLVGKGIILPVKGLRGFYRLNESLVRLGLRPVASLPKAAFRSGTDLMRWAFTMIDSILFPPPPWLLRHQPTELERQTAELIALVHRQNLEALPSPEEKLAYAAGALDAQQMLDDGDAEI